MIYLFPEHGVRSTAATMALRVFPALNADSFDESERGYLSDFLRSPDILY